MSGAELFDLGWKVFVWLFGLAAAGVGGWFAHRRRIDDETRNAIRDNAGEIRIVDNEARDRIQRVESAMRQDMRALEDRMDEKLDEHAKETRAALQDQGETIARIDERLQAAPTREDIRELERCIGKIGGTVESVSATLGGVKETVSLINDHLIASAQRARDNSK